MTTTTSPAAQAVADGPPASPSTQSAFAFGDFRLLFASQLIARLGDSFGFLALVWIVKELTGSALLMGSVLATMSLVMVVFGPLAGVLADRWEKRRLMLATALGRGGVFAALALLHRAGLVATDHLILLATVDAVLVTLANPAQQGAVTYAVGKEALVQANALLGATQQGSQMVGPLLAGLAVAGWGLEAALWIDVASYVAAAALIAATRIRSHTSNRPFTLRHTLGEMREGLQAILQVPILRVVITVAPLINFVLAPVWALLPLYAERVSDLGPKAMGYLQGAQGAGMVLGSLLTSWVGSRLPKGPVTAAGMLIMAGGTLAMAWARDLPGAAAAIAVLGFGVPVTNVPLFTFMQERVAPDRQGRAFSVLFSLAMAAQPVSMAGGGAAADAFGLVAVLVAGGLVTAAMGLGMAALPVVRSTR